MTNPDLTLQDQTEIQIMRNRETPVTGSRDRVQFVKQTRDEILELGGEDRLKRTIKTANISDERLKHNIATNLREMDPGRRSNVEGKVMLGKELADRGYENLDTRQQENIVRAICERLGQRPDARQRFPGYTGQNPFGNTAIKKEAIAMAKTEKYREKVIGILERAGEDETNISDELDKLEAELAEAAGEKESKQDQLKIAEAQKARKQAQVDSFDPSKESIAGTKAYELKQARDEEPTLKGGLATKQAALAANNKIIETANATLQLGGKLSPTQLAQARAAQLANAGLNVEIAGLQGKLERVGNLEQEWEQREGELLSATEKVGTLKKEFNTAEAKHVSAQRAKTTAEMERRVKEGEYVKKVDALAGAVDEYDEAVLNDAIDKQIANAKERQARAEDEADRRFHAAQITRWIDIKTKPRLGLKGGIGNKEYRESKKLASGKLRSQADVEIWLTKGPDEFLKGFLTQESGMTFQQVEKFLSNPENSGKIADMKQEVFDNLIQHATRDKAITPQQLAVLRTQPWFQESLKASVNNNKELSGAIPADMLDKALKGGSIGEINLLFAILRALAGMLNAAALSKS